MVSESKPSDAKRMAVGMPTGQGTPFYDPFYRVNVQRSSFEDSNLRYFDDFSVFNYLHLPKPQSLSINSPRASLDPSQNQSSMTRSGSQEAVFESVPKLSTPPRSSTEAKYDIAAEAGNERQRAAEKSTVNAA